MLGHGMGLEPVAPDWPPLTLREVRRVLGNLPGLDAGAAVICWHSPRPFSAAAIVSVPASGNPARPLLVKRHHRDVRTDDGISEEHGFMGHLRARGIPVPQVAADGHASAWAEDNFVYEVQDVLDGDDAYRDALSWTPFLSAGHAEEAGAALARLHLASEGYRAPARRTAPLLASCGVITSEDPVGALGDLAEQRPGLAGYLSQRSAPWREELGRALAPLHERFLPHARALLPLWAHNDWHPSNLMWSDAGPAARVVGVIDFGLCNLTTACYDLATAIERSAIGWLVPPGRRPVRTDLVRALLRGYGRARQLSPPEVAALPHLLPVVHVEYALSEVEYFHAVVRSPANAALAYEGYLLGHLEWFAGAAGARLVAEVGRALSA